MNKMNFFIKYLKETIEGINYLIDRNQLYINMKRLRFVLGVKAYEKSKINFYWRNLQLLEEKNIITLLSDKSPSKLYKLPNSKININGFINALELNN